jgi:GntR family transcriptional regulator
VKALQTIEIASATPDEANVLDIGIRDSVLLIERTTYAEGEDQPAEFVSSIYRGDRYKFSMEMNA